MAKQTMPSYLLRGYSPEEMQAWRTKAAVTGHASFASYARSTLNEASTPEPEAVMAAEGTADPINWNHHHWSGPIVAQNLVLLSVECHKGEHKQCSNTAVCQCGCH